MKLLEPLSGYKLVTGHAFFHLALFVVTFFVEKGDDQPHLEGELTEDYMTVF